MSYATEKKRLKPMFEHNETTMKTSYNAGKLPTIIRTEYKYPKPSCLMKRPSLKYLHTMKEWAVPTVPFDLYWKEETDIDRSDPRILQKPFVEPKHPNRESVIRSRPRVVMIPAASLDDVEEPTRQIIIDDIYLSTSKLKTRQLYEIQEAKGDHLRVKAPLPEKYAPALPIRLPTHRVPYVSPEWRMESVSWEGGQVRGFCDVAKTMWHGR